MITTTRMSYYQQPEVALILLLMRHLQEHKGCVCCRGIWMDDSCTDQHLVRSGTGRAGPSQAEPSQVRFLSKKLISQADCWRASQKQSHRHREEESARFSSADCCERLLQAADVVTAASRSDDLMEPNTQFILQVALQDRDGVRPAGFILWRAGTQKLHQFKQCVYFALFTFRLQTFRVLSLIFLRYQI